MKISLLCSSCMCFLNSCFLKNFLWHLWHTISYLNLSTIELRTYFLVKSDSFFHSSGVFTTFLSLPSVCLISIWVLYSQFTFWIISTRFTLYLCKKFILTHYRYIWCFIVYTSYGCFFEGHLRWFNRWPMWNLFHNVYNLCVIWTFIRKGVQVKKIGAQIEVESITNGQKSRYWDTREGSPTLSVVGAILTY